MVSRRPNRPGRPYGARIQLVVCGADRRISCAAANGRLSTAMGKMVRGIAAPRAGSQLRSVSERSITKRSLGGWRLVSPPEGREYIAQTSDLSPAHQGLMAHSPDPIGPGAAVRKGTSARYYEEVYGKLTLKAK